MTRQTVLEELLRYDQFPGKLRALRNASAHSSALLSESGYARFKNTAQQVMNWSELLRRLGTPTSDTAPLLGGGQEGPASCQ